MFINKVSFQNTSNFTPFTISLFIRKDIDIFFSIANNTNFNNIRIHVIVKF